MVATRLRIGCDEHRQPLAGNGCVCSWHIKVSDASGTLLTQTDPVLWSSVEGFSNDAWFYWRKVYTGAYWADVMSDWVYLRDYVDPEPTSALGGEEALS